MNLCLKNNVSTTQSWHTCSPNHEMVAQSWNARPIMKTFFGQSEMKWLFCTLVTQLDYHVFPRNKNGGGPTPTTRMKTTIALMQNHLHHNQKAIDATISASWFQKPEFAIYQSGSCIRRLCLFEALCNPKKPASAVSPQAQYLLQRIQNGRSSFHSSWNFVIM